MLLIICNRKQKVLYEEFASKLTCKRDNDFFIIGDTEEFHKNIATLLNIIDEIIIEISLDWNSKSFQNFYGFELAESLRRDYLIKKPVVFVSSFKKRYFEKLEINNLLNARGFGFISFPFSIDEIQKEFAEIPNLTDSELNEIVINQCGLKKEWRKISHRLGGCLENYKQNKNIIDNLLERWSKTIERFAPNQTENLNKLQQLVSSPLESVSLNDLRKSLQTLDTGLMNLNLEEIEEEFPNCPPKGYSKVLIADDEQLDSLINGLQHEFSYEVLAQAKSFSEAKRLLVEKKPTVVLSDFYFKKYASDKTTDKEFGKELMREALKVNIGTNASPIKPIVAVISKTSLDPEIDLTVRGVLNCSGAFNATDPQYIHNAIWTEAKKRGVTETEKIGNEEWSLEHKCQQKLEYYEKEVSKLIRQWSYFRDTVNETLELINQIKLPKNSDDANLVSTIIEILNPYQKSSDFSLAEVEHIFTEIEKQHKKAKEGNETDSKLKIRNILHGKIEQFSCVANGIKSVRRVISKTANDLISLPKFDSAGQMLKKSVNDFDKELKLLPFLEALKKELVDSLSKLPKTPRQNKKLKISESIKQKYHVIIIEDNKYWRENAVDSVEKVKDKLGENFEISYEYFENTSHFLQDFSEKNKERRKNDVKTIAIADICLPESDKKLPDSKNGIELIKQLASYTINIPVIVCSTKTSLSDIRTIGKLGISDENFVVKDFQAEESLVKSLIRLIEKREKYIIRVISDEENVSLTNKFLINKIHIDFPPELHSTFEALHGLKENGSKYSFTAEEIFIQKLRNSEENRDYVELPQDFKPTIHDHINRIRKLIFKIFQENNRYIDVRNLLRTASDDENDSSYELNVELPSYEDDEYFQEDYEIFQNRKYKVLVVESNYKIQNEIKIALEKLNDTEKVKVATADFDKVLSGFSPDIVCISLEQIDYLPILLHSLSQQRLGIIVFTSNQEKNHKILIQKTRKIGISSNSVIATSEKDWINTFLAKLNIEKRRVFLGEVSDSAKEVSEPIIEVVEMTKTGGLKLKINGQLCKVSKGPKTQIITLLLKNVRNTVSFEAIKHAIGDDKPVNKNFRTNNTQRIRQTLVKSEFGLDYDSMAEKIVESSSDGLKLNAQVIDKIQ